MGVIPQPLRSQQQPGQCVLPQTLTIGYSDQSVSGIATHLATHLRDQLGLNCSSVQLQIQQLGDLESRGFKNREGRANAGAPYPLLLLHEPALDGLPNPEEGYELVVREGGVLMRAQGLAGLFYAVQTLRQLLPPTASPEGDLLLDCVTVVDAPRFTWRGTLLDCGRHFFSVALIKRMLDVMAMLKYNRFHWHLTEDQGWRLEIKAFPKLTSVGAWRGGDESGRRYGGYYTQDEVREVVRYAAERFIVVVPEIELPGHCGAALASYPHLSCTGQVTEVPTQWGVHEDVFCAGKEATFQFLEGVLLEVLELFPGDYIHIGGDEVPKVRWEGCPDCRDRMAREGLADAEQLQSWFVRRIGGLLTAAGRRFIGWDEILEGGIPPGAIVMSWRGVSGGVEAARAGHDVIMTPTSHCYFDYRQSPAHDEPGAWFAMLPLPAVYSFDPIPHSCCPDDELDSEPHHEPSPSPPPADGGGPWGEGFREPSPGPEAALAACERGDGGGRQWGGLGVTQRSDDSSGGGEADGAVRAGDADVVMRAAYSNNQVPLEAEAAVCILGGQANIWTEYLEEEGEIEYMLLPRGCAMAEALWSPPGRRDWPDFRARLQAHLPYLDALGLQYRPLDC